MITLTDSAAKKVHALIEREGGQTDMGLRVRVTGGGCSGMQYQMGFEVEAREDDSIYDVNGVKVFIDDDSGLYLDGVQIDYLDGISGSGFKITNPNAQSTCGCGKSFS
ncbi:MAG: iron-sulfur cluster insertion protein ErpA [Myxococcales bacterium]|nr:iron-sulfur cluster insertion protein ErpA [Myxococcales bacterium]